MQCGDGDFPVGRDAPGPGPGGVRTPVAETGPQCDNRRVLVEGHLYGDRVWFSDTRSPVRRMGVSAHAVDSTVVISLWQGDVCTGTFRLPAQDAGRLISTLAYGMAESIPRQSHDSDLRSGRPADRSRRGPSR